MSRWKIKTAACYALVFIGLLQIIGLVPGLSYLKTAGMMSAASPLPLVFTHFRGLETFSSTFTVRVNDGHGLSGELTLDPQNYAKLGGPYNRRNAYGTVISYGAKMNPPWEKRLVQSVLTYGFCKNGPLAGALGITNPVSTAEIFISNPVTSFSSKLEVTCH